MARPTTDPKPHVLSLRLGDADLAALDELADALGASRANAALRVLRAFARRKGATTHHPGRGA
ncbi:MAG TPA: ribbon-helix-helix protein, CopG family [Gemmatimonadales bacterium]|nr:ribbon-helix-helix protein, CopG family [Gemmatimonadales bacterium]